MPHLGEFNKKTHANLTAQGDLHTPKDHASRHEGGDDALTLTSIDSLACRIKTGTYTGDGTESQAIIGLGFQPKFIQIFQGVTTTGNAMINFFKTEDFATDGALRDMAGYHNFYTNMIKSLDSDGFTVSDYGGDIPPNKLDETYYYVAFG